MGRGGSRVKGEKVDETVAASWCNSCCIVPPQIWPQRRQCCNSCHGFATARPSLKFGFVFFLCQTVLNHRDIKDGGVCSNVRFSFVFTLTECILTCICKTQQQIWPQRGPLFWICPLFKSAIQLLARGGWYLLALFEGVKILTTLWACELWFFIKNTNIPTTKSKHNSKC